MYTNKEILIDLLINKSYKIYCPEFREEIINSCFDFSDLIENLGGNKLKPVEIGREAFEIYEKIEDLILYYISVLETHSILHFNNLIVKNKIKWEVKH